MKKRYYFLSILILFLFNICNVNGLASYDWGIGVDYSTDTWFRDCTEDKLCNTSASAGQYWGLNGDNQYPFMVSGNLTSVGYSHGVQVGMNLPYIFLTNHLYSFSTFICSTSSYGMYPLRYSNGRSGSSTDTNNQSYIADLYGQFQVTSLSTVPYETIINPSGGSNSIDFFSQCYAVTGVIQPTIQGSIIALQFTSKWTTTGQLAVIGYELHDLGVTDNLTYNQINSIVNNATSGLATSSSIEEVQNSINIVEQQIEETNNKLDTTNKELGDINDNITNNDSSGASDEAENFFSNFNTDTFGLTSVITAPLELIKSVTSKSCTPLKLTLPFVNKDLNLPCLSTIYENYFGSFLTIYRTITFGFVSYWVCIKIFNLVKDFKNPEHDEIEVLDL